jgi:hypothetical protein
MGQTTFCHCRGERIDWEDCDGCGPDDSWLYEDDYEEPPLYADGKLTGMTPEQLIAERDRQNRIHDMAVDRCEEINSPTIETAAARARVIGARLIAGANKIDPQGALVVAS